MYLASKISDCHLLQLPKITTEAGGITAINNTIDVPFNVERVYYLYDIPGGETRGGHAHKNLYQLLVAGSGSFDVLIDDGRTKEVYSLNRPYHALVIVPGIWRELVNFSSGSICLVLASSVYAESDYIRDYDVFKKLKTDQ